MKWISPYLFLLLALLKIEAQALVLDCRTTPNPRDGYVVFLTETEGRLQAVQNEELVGPVYWGKFQSPPTGYLYVLRMELTENNLFSFFELWIPEPSDSEDIRAWFFDYGPTLRSPRAAVGVKGLHCHVISEPTPKIFRSEI